MNLNDEELQIVSGLARRQLNLEAEVMRAEVRLKELKAQLEEVRSIDLPNALAECGLTEIKLLDGQKITIKDHYYGSISEENRPRAFGWLRRNNLDGIIKNVVKIEFGKGEDAEARAAIDLLAEKGYAVQQQESVHPMTLKSFIKDLYERGVEFPAEVFGAGVKKETKITEPKK